MFGCLFVNLVFYLQALIFSVQVFKIFHKAFDKVLLQIVIKIN